MFYSRAGKYYYMGINMRLVLSYDTVTSGCFVSSWLTELRYSEVMTLFEQASLFYNTAAILMWKYLGKITVIFDFCPFSPAPIMDPLPSRQSHLSVQGKY